MAGKPKTPKSPHAGSLDERDWEEDEDCEAIELDEEADAMDDDDGDISPLMTSESSSDEGPKMCGSPRGDESSNEVDRRRIHIADLRPRPVAGARK